MGETVADSFRRTPVPLPWHKQIDARIALFPMRQRLSPYNCRVSFRIIPFRGLLDILCAVLRYAL